MPTIVGLAGSLRRGSINLALLRAAEALMPEGYDLDVQTLHGIPLYDGDLEAESGIPPAVDALKERIVGAAGVLIATPEYNGAIPGVLKNAIDWLSRPPKDLGRVFGGRAVGLVGASPGRGGTRGAQAAFLPVLRVLGARPFFGTPLYVAGARSVFSEDGQLVDDDVRQVLTEVLRRFCAFASSR